MHSRKTLREKKLARRIVSSVVSHQDQIVSGLGDYFTPFLEVDQPLPDFATLLQLQAAALEHLRLDFQQKDRAHEAEQSNDSELRRVRDAATDGLHTKMGEIIKTFDGTYGPGRCQETLGFGIGLRKEPEQIYELAAKAIDLLSAPGFEFPSPELSGVELKAEDLRQQLAEPFKDLKGAIAALDAEKDKFDATVIAKQDADKALATGSVRHGRLIEELYKIAGHPALAERLRPSSRRGKGVAEEGGGGSGDAEPSPAADPASDPTADPAADPQPPAADSGGEGEPAADAAASEARAS